MIKNGSNHKLIVQGGWAPWKMVEWSNWLSKGEQAKWANIHTLSKGEIHKRGRGYQEGGREKHMQCNRQLRGTILYKCWIRFGSNLKFLCLNLSLFLRLIIQNFVRSYFGSYFRQFCAKKRKFYNNFVQIGKEMKNIGTLTLNWLKN